VLCYVLSGQLNREIATELSITERTIKHHRGRVMEKLGVQSTAELFPMVLRYIAWPAWPNFRRHRKKPKKQRPVSRQDSPRGYSAHFTRQDRQIWTQNKFAGLDEFGAARDELLQKVKEHPEEWFLLNYLAITDAYLDRNQEAIEEAKRAVGMWPDAVDGPVLMANLAVVYALTNEPDLAFQILDVSIKTPRGVSYGELKLDPDWDPLRRSTLRQIVSRVSPARLRGSSINAIWGALAEGGRCGQQS
jgi:hypothetical protein